MQPPGGYGPPGQPPHPGYGAQVPHGYGGPPQPMQAPLAQQPPGRIEVKVSYGARAGCAYAAAAAFLLLTLYGVVTLALAEPPKPTASVAHEQPFPVGLLAIPALGIVFLVIPLTLAAEKKRIPRYIDPNGVTMRNGAQHPWSELRGVRTLHLRLRSGTMIDRGVELQFARGSAQLIYRPITNAQEVLWIVPALQAGRNPWG